MASPSGEAPAQQVMRGFIHACAAGIISRRLVGISLFASRALPLIRLEHKCSSHLPPRGKASPINQGFPLGGSSCAAGDEGLFNQTQSSFDRFAPPPPYGFKATPIYRDNITLQPRDVWLSPQKRLKLRYFVKLAVLREL